MEKSDEKAQKQTKNVFFRVLDFIRQEKRFVVTLITILLLAIFPLVYACIGHPCLNFDFAILQSKQIEMLAIPIALAAYIAAVRIALIGHLGQKKQNGCVEENKKEGIQRILLFLIPVDFNFLLAALCMSLLIFIPTHFSHCQLEKIESIVVVSLLFSVGYLSLLHVHAWVLTFSKTFFSKKTK